MALKQDTRLYQIEKLCLDCAPKVLQELSKIYLNGRSLHSHVSSLDIQNFDEKERENIAELKESSDLSKFDFTKLVFLLLRTFNLTNSDKASLKSLRDIRNKAVHERSANDFEKAEQLLLNLAKSVDERNHKTNIFLETKSKTERLKNTEVKENPRQNKLRERLKQGNKYVTDFFQPLIVTGNITGSSYEEKIRQYLDIDCAFTSAKMVLDFDSTSALRDKTEKGNSIFTVRTAENVYRDKQFGDLLSKHPVWIYCNGYNKSSKTEEHQQQQIREWRKERKKGVNKALEEMKNKYSGILKVIILVYEDCAQNDPLFKITRDMIENDFPDTCDLLIISENDEFISTLKKTSSDYCYSEECEDIFLTGMSWDLVSDEMKTSFRVKTDIDCVLPCRAGNTAIMTRKERSVYTDFDIVSGEECIHEIEGMEMQQRRTKMEETKRNFYIGKGISWWNFYFEGQVGKRCVFEEYCRQIRNKLDNGKHTEKFTLSHNPGAGGTTVGMHILWQFSQFSQANGPQNAYRCCILKKITSTTTQQLVNFCMFKEKENQKPVIVLIDDEQEDAVNDFYDELYDEAKKHSHLKLLCLVVVVKRKPTGLNVKIQHTLLTPKLKAEEKMWFDDKYKELEDNYNIEYVNSLISFNFLKNSYEPSVIQKTTDRLIKELKKEEKDILKCLSVIGTFERKRHALPFRVFDVLVERTATKETWNTHLSEAMNLLITETQDEDAVGISVISQPLAKAVLDNFKTVDGINLEFLVDYLLDLIEKNRMNGRYLSQKLRTVIGGLFKREERTGPSATDKDKEKDDFSALIFKLAEQRTNETLECAHKRTVAALQRCFKLTEDPMVGQQVARFYNHICQFSEAIETIKKSIDMKPSSSYLLDTYGHIFKTKMDFLIKQGIAEERKIPDKKASEIIDIAFHAVGKFSEAQMIAYKEHLKSTKRNISCFYNEIRTIMLMLENFKEFESYSTCQDFLKFLNEPSYTLEASRFKSLVELNPKVNDLKQGTDYQVHLMEILQYTRDRTNQIKYYKVDSEEGDLILKFSERLARFYGDSKSTGHCYFTCPIDLKAMMDGLSDKKKRDSMIARVEASKENLESKVVDVDDRDLLVYLGYMIIELSGTLLSSEEKYSEDEYKKLLKYSKCLIESQTQIPGRILLEVFLYHGMLHWPSDTRTEKDLDDFCPPTKYKEYLRKWESNFYSNHSLKTKEQKEKNRAKIFFALGKGRPGNDIINLKVIQQWLRQMQNSSVDEVWDEEIVKEQLKSFRGIVNGEGTAVSHTVGILGGKIQFHFHIARLSVNKKVLDNIVRRVSH